MVWEQLKFVKFNDEQHKEDKTMNTELIEIDGKKIRAEYVTDYYRDRLINEDIYELYKVPKKYRTLELCTIGVKKWGGVLREVPEELINAELCELAIFSGILPSIKNIQYVPERFRTYHFISRILKKFHGNVASIETKTLTHIAASTKKRVFEFSHNGYKLTITKED